MSSDPPMRLDEFGPYIFNGEAKVFVVPEEFLSEHRDRGGRHFRRRFSRFSNGCDQNLNPI